MTPETNRPGSRLQPERRGAALIREGPVFFPDNRGHKKSVHDFDSALDSSGNHKALLSAKLDQVRLDGEPHESPGLALVAAFIDARHEFAECQGFLSAIIFHALKYKSSRCADDMGCSPHKSSF
jgi:hypothetical protein